MARPIMHPNLRVTLQAPAEGLMPDTCARVVTTPVKDSYGQVKQTPNTGATFACRFDPGTTLEQTGGPTDERTSVVTTPTIRLPLSADGVVRAKDRLQLTHRYGVALAVPLTYEIVGDPRALLTAVECDLRRVTL